MKRLKLSKEAWNAIILGSMCAVSYLAVYIARNMLTATSNQIVNGGIFTEEALGILSSVYFVTYACGQLINGFVGDKIKAKYMISFGLILSGVCTAVFSLLSGVPIPSYIAYGSSGFFLSMIYGPMTKTVAENTNPVYATRCSLGYTFASLIGTPIAGLVAVLVAWNFAFRVSAFSLIFMGVMAFLGFTLLERKGIIRYDRIPESARVKGTGNIRTLLRRQILKFTVIAMVTGVVRTAVTFWLPTYLKQQLSFSEDTATMLFTLCTSILSVTTFLTIFVYELLKRDMDKAILIYFSAASLCFLALLFVRHPVLNIALLILSIMASNCADNLMWARYCPSLWDTGLTSTATGYLDFVSYIAAAIATAIFPHAKNVIGWNGLILVWMGLMLIGLAVSLPNKKKEVS